MTSPAIVKRTSIGPELSIAGVQVTSWFGTIHNDLADEIAADINIALAVREAAKDATIARLSAELREAFDAGVEQGSDEATAYEWGARPRQSSDDAFKEYLRDHERRAVLAKIAKGA